MKSDKIRSEKIFVNKKYKINGKNFVANLLFGKIALDLFIRHRGASLFYYVTNEKQIWLLTSLSQITLDNKIINVKLKWIGEEMEVENNGRR
jgi:hypothetical protein